MNELLNIVIPMAGEGSRFKSAGYEKPKPFIDVDGKPMIQWVIENLQVPDANYYLIARGEHLEKEKELVARLESEFPLTFISVNQLTEGTACTVLFARQYINNEHPLLIANSDQWVEFSLAEMIADARTRKLDGSILTFTDLEKNPKWSFAKTDADTGLVTEVKEKVVISDYATVGIYYFSKGRYFVDAALDMIVHNERVNNEFYTCPVYNWMIRLDQKIGIYNIGFEDMHGLGTPSDLDLFLSHIRKNP